MYGGFYLQVRDKETGAVYPIPEERWDAKLFERLDEPPVDTITGQTLNAKPRTTVADQAKKKSGQSADTTKEKS